MQCQDCFQNDLSLWGTGFIDKNSDGIVDAFDFDNDQILLKKISEEGLLGKSWSEVGNKINSLFNKTDTWVVQNNQSISQIAVMVLKQINPNYSKADIDIMVKQLIEMNLSKLDGSKEGFLVNAKIKLPFAIDISKEKISKNPVYDYVKETQSKRIRDLVSKFNLINSNSINSTTYCKQSVILPTHGVLRMSTP